MDLLIRGLIWLVRYLQRLSSGKNSAGKGGSHFEVERKFALSNEEFRTLPGKLRELGFHPAGKQRMTDTFIPAASESDMIRVRDLTEQQRTTTVLTLKTWVTVGDGRERKESESDPIDEVTRDCLLALGRRLSDEDLMSFSKSRTEYDSTKDPTVTVALDQVEGLGEFSGPYLEIEVIATSNEQVARARDSIGELAGKLLGDADREVAPSYMEMLRKSRKKASKK